MEKLCDSRGGRDQRALLGCTRRERGAWFTVQPGAGAAAAAPLNLLLRGCERGPGSAMDAKPLLLKRTSPGNLNCCVPIPPLNGLSCGLVAAAGQGVCMVLSKRAPGAEQTSRTRCNGTASAEDLEATGIQLSHPAMSLGQPRRTVEEQLCRGHHEGNGAPYPVHSCGQKFPLQSAHIPVPGQRKLSEKAGIDEVMAAAVLTSLSTSPVVLSQSASTCTAESCGENWKEGAVMSSSYSSSTNSGDWNWDLPSDHSVPSTPSPPLSIEVGKNFLLTAQSDEGIEDTEATQFLFGDPIPRKRKNSVKVMFKCLWKNCGKVLSTSTGIQKHIRALHLGKADLDQSDGEEDFYYTEIDINVDSLTDGLSSLAPMSPTASVPPAFPLPETQGIHLPAETSEVPLVSSLSHSAPTTLCHVHSDHAYQALSPISICAGSSFSFSWQPPPLLLKSSPGCLAQIQTVGIGEKLPQIAHSAVIKTSTVISVPKPALGTRFKNIALQLIELHWLPVKKSPVEKPRNVGRYMAWRTGTCGVQLVVGRRRVSDSQTEC
uniref:Zinc finger protein 704-like isoform X2 n=1 Tax=Geotrypetes seraphini TaxID=260995 RepID=A0A6P8SS93_GEOSA|nr:zinc finger protein 704-like isoform X2 [Geotrypetes seraphini]